MSEHISYERRGHAAIVTLDRPDALNAMTIDMLRILAARLDEAEAEPDVKCIIVRSTSEKAFSTGGDIRALLEWGRQGRPDLFQFFREEYALNARIDRLKKPYVALLHGHVLGGGAGISLHGSHRVVDGRVSFAMPEVRIGLVPDVGASRFLREMPGRTGLYLGLTGAFISSSEMLWAGLATHHVPRARFDDLVEHLVENGEPDAALAELGEDLRGPCELEDMSERIDALFAGHDTAGIVAALEEEGRHVDFARRAAEAMRTACPTGLRLAHALYERAEGKSLAECLTMEFRVVSRLIQRTDFYEGIRAAIVDKDRAPRWQPEGIGDVSDADVDAYFEPSPLAEPVLE